MSEDELIEITPGTTMVLKDGTRVTAVDKPYLYPDGDESEILLPCSDGRHHCASDLHPICYKPEPDNPYPLCVGRDAKECEDCCLYMHYADIDGNGPYDGIDD